MSVEALRTVNEFDTPGALGHVCCGQACVASVLRTVTGTPISVEAIDARIRGMGHVTTRGTSAEALEAGLIAYGLNQWRVRYNQSVDAIEELLRQDHYVIALVSARHSGLVVPHSQEQIPHWIALWSTNWWMMNPGGGHVAPADLRLLGLSLYGVIVHGPARMEEVMTRAQAAAAMVPRVFEAYVGMLSRWPQPEDVMYWCNLYAEPLSRGDAAGVMEVEGHLRTACQVELAARARAGRPAVEVVPAAQRVTPP